MNRFLFTLLCSVFLAWGGISKEANAVVAAEKPHAVIVVGTHHYSPQLTMPPLAAELERLGFRTTVINPDWDPEKDKRGLPGLEALKDADVGVFFLRFLKLDDKQLGHITRFLESGKPVVGLRTSTHAFNYPAGHRRHALNNDFGRNALGTPYLIHLASKTKVKPAKDAADHPILTGVGSATWESPGKLYLIDAQPGIQILLNGTGNSKKVGKVTNQFGTHKIKKTMTAPIAWTWKNKWGGRVFASSLGHVGDFADQNSLRVMINGIFWAADQPVPDAKTEIQTFAVSQEQIANAGSGKSSFDMSHWDVEGSDPQKGETMVFDAIREKHVTPNGNGWRHELKIKKKQRVGMTEVFEDFSARVKVDLSNGGKTIVAQHHAGDRSTIVKLYVSDSSERGFIDSRAKNGVFDVYVRMARENGSGEEKRALGTIKTGESFDFRLINNKGFVTVSAFDKSYSLKVKDSSASYLKFGNYLQAQDPVTRRKVKNSDHWAKFYRDAGITKSVITYSNLKYVRRPSSSKTQAGR